VSDAAERSRAVEVVEDFLAAIGAGRWDSAERHLAPGALIVFPGGAVHESLAQVRDSGAARYRRIDKVREHYDSATGPDGAVVVVSTGTLFGENLHGVPFANVRYVDRFVLRDGLVHEQHVWNDLALSGVLTATDLSAVPEQWRGPADSAVGQATSTAPVTRAPAAIVRRFASATWRGDLRVGAGTTSFGSGAVEDLPFSLQSRRSGDAEVTSAEELIAAAHASCFAMSLRGALDRTASDIPGGDASHEVVEVRATCSLRIDQDGWTIEALHLEVAASGIEQDRLDAAVARAERTCTVSRLVEGRARVTVATAAVQDA
jgi:OsmC subfamily peroxiredoxin